MKKSYTIEDMQIIARKHGGKCLSRIYTNSKTKLKWQCKYEHEWLALYGPILKGHWCPNCAGNQRLNIEVLNKFAKKNGGKSHSSVYLGKDKKYDWECKNCHRWKATFGSVSSGTWCRACYTESRIGKTKYSITDAQKKAILHGGKCLTKTFVNANQVLQWKCKFGHIFENSLAKVNFGNWCTECKKGYVGEKVTRAYFEAIFKKPFPKVRPDWLRLNGKKLELDGFSQELGIAFEHHGVHHYKIERYSPTKQDLARRKKVDAAKSKLCKSNNVILIIVPEVPRLLPLDKLPVFLKKELRKKRILIEVPKIDVGAAIYGNEKEKYLNKINEVAVSKGGQLISKNVISAKQKLKFKCAKGHNFEMSSDKMLRGQWCPGCKKDLIRSSLEKKWLSAGDTIETLKKHALNNDGTCLSGKFTGPGKKYLWQCANGHNWSAEWKRVKKGSWCGVCANRAITEKLKVSIEVFKKIADKNGGVLLSKEYGGAKSKLKFKCKNGHVFESLATNISRGHWCRYCGYRKDKISV